MARHNPAGWLITSEKQVNKFRIFETRTSTRVNPRTGKPFDFFLISGLNWTNIIPLTPDGEVVLVRQYRHGAEQFTLEIPGGCIEADETDPSASALRELSEETGYTSDTIEPLGVIQANPALQSQQCYVYVARNAVKKSEPHLDPGEDIQVVLKPLNEVWAMLARGEISHALVVAAFGLLKIRDDPAL